VFDAEHEFCWVSYRLADHRKVVDKMSESQRAAVQVSARFREGREPDVYAGLGLSADEAADGGGEGERT
jgi:hypothetical protein